jgi:hypothetical protein
VLSQEGSIFFNLNETSVVVLSKYSESTLTTERLFTNQIQVATIGNDGNDGERRIIHNLQQYTRNLYNPLVKIASNIIQVYLNKFIL